MRILVIEDDQKIAQAVKRGLELKGFAVDAVYDGDAGYAYASDPDYDVIVLDRMLPGSMDGVELCKKLRHDPVAPRARAMSRRLAESLMRELSRRTIGVWPLTQARLGAARKEPALGTPN